MQYCNIQSPSVTFWAAEHHRPLAAGTELQGLLSNGIRGDHWRAGWQYGMTSLPSRYTISNVRDSDSGLWTSGNRTRNLLITIPTHESLHYVHQVHERSVRLIVIVLSTDIKIQETHQEMRQRTWTFFTTTSSTTFTQCTPELTNSVK